MKNKLLHILEKIKSFTKYYITNKNGVSEVKYQNLNLKVSIKNSKIDIAVESKTKELIIYCCLDFIIDTEIEFFIENDSFILLLTQLNDEIQFISIENGLLNINNIYSNIINPDLCYAFPKITKLPEFIPFDLSFLNDKLPIKYNDKSEIKISDSKLQLNQCNNFKLYIDNYYTYNNSIIEIINNNPIINCYKQSSLLLFKFELDNILCFFSLTHI